MQNSSLQSPARSECPSYSDLHDSTAEGFDESSFESLLRSNVVPDDESLLKFSRYVEEKAEEIRCVDAEILQLQNTLSMLCKTREGLQRTHDVVKGLGSPIRRLPVDILGAIFELSANLDIKFVDGTSEILRISQVCHHWRHTTQSMPRLWAASLWEVDVDFYAESQCPDHPGFISHYLHMSQSIPLRLRITALQPDYVRYKRVKNKRHLPEVLGVLLFHTDRWGSAELNFYDDEWDMVYTNLRKRHPPLNGYFPNLQELMIPHVVWGPRNAIDSFGVAPNLSSLRVYGVPDSFTFPYSQLKASDLTSGRCFYILPKCSTLEKLKLVCPDRRRDPYGFQRLPNLSTLLELEIECLDDDVSYCFENFNDCTLSSLEKLRIKANGDWCSLDSKLDSTLVSMILRSSCPLQALHLQGMISITRDQLYQLFRTAPMLTSLVLQDTVVSWDELFDMLTIQPSTQYIDDVLLPRLEDFLATYTQSRSCEMPLRDEFDVMTKSRQPPSVVGVSFLTNSSFKVSFC